MSRASSSSTLAVMSASAGIAAANLYYAQPLLPAIAAGFGVETAAVALLPALTQVGFAIGILFLVPLADVVERRRLIITILLLLSGVLLLHALAPTPGVLIGAALGLGLVGITPQLLAPFAALLAPTGQAGMAVGTVLSGVLSGIVLSRVVAGGIAQAFGWRTVFLLASAVAILLAAVLRWRLPESRPRLRVGYGALIVSSLLLLRDEPRLRRHVIYGALSFGSFMTFWSTYAIHVETAFGLGTASAGLFGFAGLAGIACASLAGRQVDRGRFSTVCVAGAGLIVLGFSVLAMASRSIPGTILGAVLLDAGASVTHAANQSSALRLRPDAIARVNSVYIAGYFLGGAVGTVAAGLAYARFGWLGTCAVGVCFSTIMLLSEVGVRAGTAAVRPSPP